MDFLSEASRIKARLNACSTMVEIDAVSDEERATVMQMKAGNGHGPVMYMQIRNLRNLLVKEFEALLEVA